jgi:hypothetical protein
VAKGGQAFGQVTKVFDVMGAIFPEGTAIRQSKALPVVVGASGQKLTAGLAPAPDEGAVRCDLFKNKLKAREKTGSADMGYEPSDRRQRGLGVIFNSLEVHWILRF